MTDAALSTAPTINGYAPFAAFFTAAGLIAVAQTSLPLTRLSRQLSAENAQKATHAAELNYWTGNQKTDTHAAELNYWTGIQKADTRAADPVVAEVSSYLDFREGWDGENAAAPNSDSIIDACVFAQRLGMSAEFITANLDVDGSVIFEIDDDRGSIMFRGGRRIVYALKNGRRGQVDFDGTTIPPEIMSAIS